MLFKFCHKAQGTLWGVVVNPPNYKDPYGKRKEKKTRIAFRRIWSLFMLYSKKEKHRAKVCWHKVLFLFSTHKHFCTFRCTIPKKNKHLCLCFQSFQEHACKPGKLLKLHKTTKSFSFFLENDFKAILRSATVYFYEKNISMRFKANFAKSVVKLHKKSTKKDLKTTLKELKKVFFLCILTIKKSCILQVTF